nr:protein O-linked-mannose beta-1,2-N-acetylglucosaminyltransferase 1-like [Penaeus vannamei]
MVIGLTVTDLGFADDVAIPSESLETLVAKYPSFVNTITYNSLGSFFLQYEASGRLQPPSRVALRSLGSWAAPHLKFHDSWVWAWRVGGSTVGEALVSSPQSILDPLSPGHLHLEVDLHVNSSALGRFCRDWPQDDLWEKRSYFCDLYDGYGDLCSCDDPFLPDNAPPRMDTWREDIAVVILAGSRPRYLYRLLGQLLTQPGMTSDLVLVSVDGEDEETIRLLEVLELRFFLHVPEGSFSSTKISRHLRFALFRALRTLPEIEKFVLLEDDLLLAPDFYSYMQQTSQILHTDPSVLAVSSYSIFGAPHTARDLSRLNRVTSLPACGWMVTRTFLKEILPMWPPAFVWSCVSCVLCCLCGTLSCPSPVLYVKSSVVCEFYVRCESYVLCKSCFLRILCLVWVLCRL